MEATIIASSLIFFSDESRKCCVENLYKLQEIEILQASRKDRIKLALEQKPDELKEEVDELKHRTEQLEDILSMQRVVALEKKHEKLKEEIHAIHSRLDTATFLKETEK